MKDSYNKIFKEVNKVLVVTAHPDDCEIICGGTVARLISDKRQVRLVVTTNGGKGTKDKKGKSEKEFAEGRKLEQIKGGIELRIPETENFNLNIPDGEMDTSLENIEKIVFHIRQFKPDIVITHNPFEIINTFSKDIKWVNHRDHRNTAITVVDAVYPYSHDTNFFPQHLREGLNPHYVTKLLFSDSYTYPNAVGIDVSNFLDKKRNAFKQHRSAVAEEDIEGFIEELQTDNGHFEILGYTEID